MPDREIVRPSVMPLTVEDARELLAPSLLRLCSTYGPTRVAQAVGGADPKTIRDARDEKSLLSLHFAANLLPYDPLALDPFLKRIGRRSVPEGAMCDTDTSDRESESKVLKAALALSVALADDGEISPDEVKANRATLEDAIVALQNLLAKRVKAVRS